MAKILVRVGTIKETPIIQSIYRVIGLNLEIVTSDQSLEENEAAIKKAIENDDCHGLISVGMLGEGLDLPVLKIAVMHAPHQSFPVTLQFIGRICRTTENIEGTSKLIAIPEDIQEHTKGLYDLDANWTELIPDLTDASIGLEQERRQFSHQRWSMSEDSQVSLHTLRPTFAVCVYQVLGEIDIFARLSFKGNSIFIQEFTSLDRNWRVIITKTYAKPLWSTSKSIQDVIYDLHIYYRTGDLLFEYSKSVPIANDIRDSIGGNRVILVDPGRIEQIISQSPLVAYYNVGLRRVTYSSSTIPTYKMLAGSHAEDTIRAADGNFFTIGHLFGKVAWGGDELVIGFSSQKAKIWSSTRDHIKEFTVWCDVVAGIINNENNLPLPFIEHLKQPTPIAELPAEPFSIVLHQKTFDHIAEGMRVEIVTDDSEIISLEIDDVPEISIQAGSWNPRSPHHCIIEFRIDDQEIILLYDIQAKNIYSWEPTPPLSRCSAKVPIKGRNREFDFHDYFNEYPPTLYLSDGSAVVGGYHYPFQSRLSQVPDAIMKAIDWATHNCEIGVEDINMVQDEDRRIELIAAERNDVLNATSLELPEIITNPILAFIDHRSGEIADIIVVEVGEEAPIIHLFHCKASHTENPGVDLQNAYVVLHQARKCLRFMFKQDLFEEIRTRATDDTIITGSLRDFNRAVSGFTPQTVKYVVHIVQPGFSIGRIRKWHDESLRLMLLSLYDELHNQDVELKVIGSN